MTVPVEQRQSAPARGTRVGLQLNVPDGRWLPMVVDKFLPDGSLTFRHPNDPSPTGRRIGVKLSWSGWRWLPAAQCVFTKLCPKCKGHRTAFVGTELKPCVDCAGQGEVHDPNPFRNIQE